MKYAFDTNTLYIEKVENIKELEIDCQLLFENRYKEVFGKEPISLEFADFLEENDGIFTVIINTNTPMEKLEFIDTPLPKRVKVNKVDWWETKTSYYTLDQNNITITHIPKGSTTVEIYFKDPGNKSPNAMFSASDYIALRNEQITFDASLSSDEDGEIIDYIWDLGDKTQNISKIITHSYSEAGNYTVILSVRDDDDLVDFYFENISIVGSNKDFKKVIVDDVEIEIRSSTSQNLSIEMELEVPEIPESILDFGVFLNITSNENVSRFQLKINLGPIGGKNIPTGTDPESIKLFYFDEDLKKWVKIEDSYYDPETGILTAKIEHLTVFAPMASKMSGEKKEDDGDGDITIYVVLIIIVIVIISILGILFKKQKCGKTKYFQAKTRTGKSKGGTGKSKGGTKKTKSKKGKGKIKVKKGPVGLLDEDGLVLDQIIIQREKLTDIESSELDDD